MARVIKHKVIFLFAFIFSVIAFGFKNYYLLFLFVLILVSSLLLKNRYERVPKFIFYMVLIEILVIGLNIDLITASPFFHYLAEGCQIDERYEYLTQNLKIYEENTKLKRFSRVRSETIAKIEKVKDFQGTVIGIFGDSNTYGAGKEYINMTYPYYLNEILNNNHLEEYIVLNLGVPGFVVRDKVDFANLLLKNIDIDIIIFQHFGIGRKRIFCQSKNEIKLHFDTFKNNAYSELFFLPNEKLNAEKSIRNMHDTLVISSGTYRLLLGISYRVISIINSKQIEDAARNILGNIDYEKLSFYNFVASNPNSSIIFFNPLSLKKYNFPEVIDDFFYFELDNSGKNETYSQLYPPEYVYEWYAEELYKFLIGNNLIQDIQ